MSGRLNNQVAIVTGGAHGIGAATARSLAREGAKVLLADIDLDGARENADSIARNGGVAESFEVDVASHDQIKAMVN